jgi:hypothetical protein
LFFVVAVVDGVDGEGDEDVFQQVTYLGQKLVGHVAFHLLRVQIPGVLQGSDSDRSVLGDEPGVDWEVASIFEFTQQGFSIVPIQPKELSLLRQTVFFRPASGLLGCHGMFPST